MNANLMEKHKQWIVILVLLSAIFFGYFLFASDGKMQMYECQSESEAHSCSSKCKKDDTKLEFKLNKNNPEIFMYQYLDGKFWLSVSLENCSIIDEKNWKCETRGNDSFTNWKMNNGIFFVEHVNFSNPNKWGWQYACAK
jgi:hypothetical protein